MTSVSRHTQGKSPIGPDQTEQQVMSGSEVTAAESNASFLDALVVGRGGETGGESGGVSERDGSTESSDPGGGVREGFSKVVPITAIEYHATEGSGEAQPTTCIMQVMSLKFSCLNPKP